MEFSKELREALCAAVESVLQAHRGACHAESLTSMEQTLQGVLQAVGNYTLGEWLNAQNPVYPAGK